MNKRTVIIIGALVGALAVILGAAGAHALKETLLASGKSDAYELAVRYQFYHVFALLITGLLMEHYPSSRLKYASLFFLLGVILFSGSLYILSLTSVTVVGSLTPLGGVSLIVGWILLLAGVLKNKAT